MMLAVTGARGVASFIDPLQISSLSELSKLVTDGTFNSLSTGTASVESLSFLDSVSHSPQVMTVSSGVLCLNTSSIIESGNQLRDALVSTVTGLGSAGYITTLSTCQLSTGVLKSGDVHTSTINLIDTVNGNLGTLTASNDLLYFNGSVVNYATINYNTSSYIYQVSSAGNLYAFSVPVSVSSASNVYINTDYFSSVSFSTGGLLTSSIQLGDSVLSVKDGILLLNEARVTADLMKQDLFSTVGGLAEIGYVSTATLLSTTDGILTDLLPPYFASTVAGLGIAGYVSADQLTSTTAGFVENVLPPFFASTVNGLGEAGYISSAQLTSSIGGVPLLAELYSTTGGLGTLGYVSTSQLASTVDGIITTQVPLVLANGQYVNTGSLLSSLSHLYVPFEENPSGLFQLFAESNTLNFGRSGSATAQIFVGDAHRSSSNPLIKISQDSSTTPRAADVLNILGGVNNEKMVKIDSNLNLGIGLKQSVFAAPSGLDYTLQVDGSVYASSCVISSDLVASNTITTSTLILAHTGTSSNLGGVASNIRLGLTSGDAYKPTGSTWQTLSDMRIKENIVEADYARCYNDVKRVPLRRYNYISSFVEQAGIQDRTVLGVVAQELVAIMPKSVTSQALYGYDDLNTVSVDQINMAALGALKKTIQDKEHLESTTQGLFQMNQELVTQIKEVSDRLAAQSNELNHVLNQQAAQFSNDLMNQTANAAQQFTAVQDTFTANLSTLRGEMESMKNDLSMSHSIL